MIFEHISYNIPPQMNILNIVIPILMHFIEYLPFKTLVHQKLEWCKPSNKILHNKRALIWVNLSSGFANNKGADQSVHLHSTISTFNINFLESTISKLSTREISVLWPVFVAEQAGLSMTSSKTPRTDSVANFNNIQTYRCYCSKFIRNREY